MPVRRGWVIDTNDVKLAFDVGGASGALLRQLREADPGLRGIVTIAPDDAAEVAAAVAGSEFGDRTEVVGAISLERAIGDPHLLKFVLHDWPAARCIEILARCREVILPGPASSSSSLAEGPRRADWRPSMIALIHLHMLTLEGGRGNDRSQNSTSCSAVQNFGASPCGRSKAAARDRGGGITRQRSCHTRAAH